MHYFVPEMHLKLRVYVQGSALVPAHVSVPVVWRRRVVLPAPQGGLISETFLMEDGRGRGTFSHCQIVSPSKKLENCCCRNRDAT